MGNRVIVAKEAYEHCHRAAPDLILYPGDLDYRASAAILPQPEGTLFCLENDTGPDGANHDPFGVLVYRPPGAPIAGRRIADQSIYDIAPSLLALLGLEAPEDMRGAPMAPLLEMNP